MKQLKIFAIALIAALTFTACGDDDDPRPIIDPVEVDGNALVVSQGSWGGTPGSLGLFMPSDRSFSTLIADLGDSPQNVVEEDGYIYVPVNAESVVKVYDARTGSLVTSIAIPFVQNICEENDFVFAVGSDSLFRINTKTKAVDQKVKVGPGLYCVAATDHYVYVPIAGTYHEWGNPENYIDGMRLAKFDINNISKGAVKEIAIGMNAYNQIAVDNNDNIFVVCNGNYADVGKALYKVTPADVATNIGEADMITISKNVLYAISSSYDGITTYKKYSTTTNALLDEDFLKEATEKPINPTFISVDKKYGNILIGSNNLKDDGSVDYQGNGLFYWYYSDGKFANKYTTGPNPYYALFVD